MAAGGLPGVPNAAPCDSFRKTDNRPPAKQQGASGGDLFAEIHNAEIDAFAAQPGGQLVGIGDVGDHGRRNHPDRAGEDAAHYVPDDQRKGMAYAKKMAATDQQGGHEQQSGRRDGGHDVQSAFFRTPGQRHPQDHAPQSAGVEANLNEAQTSRCG